MQTEVYSGSEEKDQPLWYNLVFTRKSLLWWWGLTFEAIEKVVIVCYLLSWDRGQMHYSFFDVCTNYVFLQLNKKEWQGLLLDVLKDHYSWSQYWFNRRRSNYVWIALKYKTFGWYYLYRILCCRRWQLGHWCI